MLSELANDIKTQSELANDIKTRSELANDIKTRSELANIDLSKIKTTPTNENKFPEYPDCIPVNEYFFIGFHHALRNLPYSSKYDKWGPVSQLTYEVARLVAVNMVADKLEDYAYWPMYNGYLPKIIHLYMMINANRILPQQVTVN